MGGGGNRGGVDFYFCFPFFYHFCFSFPRPRSSSLFCSPRLPLVLTTCPPPSSLETLSTQQKNEKTFPKLHRKVRRRRRRPAGAEGAPCDRPGPARPRGARPVGRGQAHGAQGADGDHVGGKRGRRRKLCWGRSFFGCWCWCSSSIERELVAVAFFFLYRFTFFLSF